MRKLSGSYTKRGCIISDKSETDRTVFGPKKKKTIYLERLQDLANGDYFDEWRSQEEVLWKVNEVVPARWTQLHSCGVHKYMRKITHDMEDKYKTVMGRKTRFWRKKL